VARPGYYKPLRLAIQPTNVLAQLEGAAVFGLSVALLEELTIQNGVPVQSNFKDMARLMR